MIELYKGIIMFLLGVVVIQIIFPRKKTINVADDYVESQKTKDNSKTKKRRGFLFFGKKKNKK